jgi:hypothetical protein
MADQPTTAVVDEAVHSAIEREGYVNGDAVVDRGVIRERIFGIVSKAKVNDRKERAAKAITRGELMRQVFPNLPGPEEWDEQETPLLAETVYKRIDGRFVWGDVKPAPSGAVQRLVGMNMGNGFVLCRTRIGKDATPAVYITDDYALIQQDYTKSDIAKLQRAARATERGQEMLMQRQPQNAQRYYRAYNKALHGVVELASGQLRLALEAANGIGDEGDD